MRFARYAVVGLVAFAIDYGLLLWLVERMPLLAANTLAFLAANAANFLMAHRFVFGRSLDRAAAPQYAGVLAVSLAGLAINDAVVWAAAGLAGLPLLAAKVLATAAAMAWNYAARATWIYGERRPS